jgi:hypothetical protein
MLVFIQYVMIVCETREDDANWGNPNKRHTELPISKNHPLSGTRSKMSTVSTMNMEAARSKHNGPSACSRHQTHDRP